MVGREHIFLRLACGAALAVVFVTAVNADKLGSVRDVLRRSPFGEERTEEDVAKSLYQTGADITLLFRLYTGERTLTEIDEGFTESEWWRHPDRFGSTYLQTLTQFSPDRVVAHLAERTSGKTTLELRLHSVRVLTALESPEGMDLLIEIASSFTPMQYRSRTVSHSLEQAFSSILESDRRSIDHLRERTDDLSDPVLDIVSASIKSVPCPQSVAFLESQFEIAPSQSPQFLGDIAEMYCERPWLFEGEAREAIRPHLFSDDWQLRSAAAVALARTRDLDSLSSLVLLLDDEQEAVAGATNWAINELTGSSKIQSPGEWTDWLDQELAWWESSEGQLRYALQSGQPHAMMGAVRSLANRPLLRDQAAQVLVEALDGSQSDFQNTICRTLEQLDSKTVVPALVELLAVRDVASRETIHATLVKLAGVDFGLYPEDWDHYIDD